MVTRDFASNWQTRAKKGVQRRCKMESTFGIRDTYVMVPRKQVVLRGLDVDNKTDVENLHGLKSVWKPKNLEFKL
jgi:hypothetical protein